MESLFSGVEAHANVHICKCTHMNTQNSINLDKLTHIKQLVNRVPRPVETTGLE